MLEEGGYDLPRCEAHEGTHEHLENESLGDESDDL